jgi:branched-chain amino acid transport system permease protein
MSPSLRNPLLFLVMAAMLAAVGFGQSWSLALTILNLCLISAVMALGLNMQWGYAGLFNVGVMGFAAVGGLATVLVSKAPVGEAWAAGGWRLALSFVALLATAAVVVVVRRWLGPGPIRSFATAAIVIVGYFIIRIFFDPATEAIEAFDSAKTGYLGGLGLPVLLSWIIGGVLAAGVAWFIGKVALGLRSDYFAIATLGISEIVIAILKNEDWLARGVKNVTGLERPVPREINLQGDIWFNNFANWLGMDVISASTIFVKLCYAGLFVIVLLIVIALSECALNSPWGRMMRAIRDNEDAAEAMGKDVARRHLQIFIIGSAVIGMAGAMLVTLDGQFTPGTYQPLRFTFIIWIMVIIGGSGNNWGSVLGGFLVWFVWIEAEPAGLWLMDMVTSGLDSTSPLRAHLLEASPHMRLIIMGVILLLVMRFSPRGLIPEVMRR